MLSSSLFPRLFSPVPNNDSLKRNPDTVRGPNISFIGVNRDIPAPKGYFETYPDLVVEIVTPEVQANLRQLLEDYFSAGTQLIWLIYPNLKQVEADTPEGISKVFRQEDTLQTELLPGFSCKVEELFEY